MQKPEACAGRFVSAPPKPRSTLLCPAHTAQAQYEGCVPSAIGSLCIGQRDEQVRVLILLAPFLCTSLELAVFLIEGRFSSKEGHMTVPFRSS